MAKMHVTDDGRVLPCTAKHSCVYSNAEDGNRHFTDLEEANAKASALLLSRHTMFSTQRRKNVELPERIKNGERPGNLSLFKEDPFLDGGMRFDRYTYMPEDSIINDPNFTEFFEECEKSSLGVKLKTS